jgi:hypothetical protein
LEFTERKLGKPQIRERESGKKMKNYKLKMKNKGKQRINSRRKKRSSAIAAKPKNYKLKVKNKRKKRVNSRK